jgi:predicted RNA binding protein YcfA (HicA-like mRNA interferase family)
MSEKLTAIIPKKALRKLKKVGFLEDHQQVSKLVLKHVNGRRAVLPMHSADIPRGTLHSIVVHQAKLDISTTICAESGFKESWGRIFCQSR